MPANAAHWHLILNHIPIMAVLFGVLILPYGAWRQNDAIVRVALALFVLAGAMVIPVYYTGDSAEEIAEELRTVTEDDIEVHEEAAEFSYYLTLAMGIYALGGLVYYRKRETASWLFLSGAVTLGIVVLISLANTATKGAHIRHPEISMKAPAQDQHTLESGALPEED